METQNVNAENIHEIFLSSLENDLKNCIKQYEASSADYIAPWQVYEEPS